MMHLMLSEERSSRAETASPPAGPEPSSGETGASGTPDAPGPACCAHCNTALRGRFCHHCGQRAVAPSDYALTARLKRAFKTLARLDSRALRSLAFLFRPGFLTQAYLRGHRVPYLRPLQLFVVANVIFYFFAAWTSVNIFRTPLYWHAEAVHTPIAKPLVEQRAQQVGSYMAYAQRFDPRAAVLSKVLVICMVPAFALLLLLVNWRREHAYVKHLVFSLHFYAFFLLVQLLLWAVLFVPARALTGGGEGPVAALLSGTSFALLLGGIVAFYLFAALRRAYPQPIWLAGLKSIALTLGAYYVLFGYRVGLFFATYYSLL